MNHKRRFKEGISAFKINVDLIRDRGVIASRLNEYFRSVFTEKETNEIPEMPLRTNKIFSINTFINFSPQNIEKYLSKLNVNKSPGPDKIAMLHLF